MAVLVLRSLASLPAYDNVGSADIVLFYISLVFVCESLWRVFFRRLPLYLQE